MGSSKHIGYIDLAKGLCITWVVLHHVMCNYDAQAHSNRYVMVFVMPLFFFLSGMFFKTYGDRKEFLRKKTNSLLVPFVAYYALTVVMLPWVMKWCGLPILPAPSGFDCIADIYREHWGTNRALWFLLCLLEVNLLYWLLHSLTGKLPASLRTWAILTAAAAMGACGYALSKLGINLPLFLDTALTVVPFFACGHLLMGHRELLEANKYDKYNWLMAAVCLGICYLTSGRELFVSNKYATNLPELYCCGLTGIMGVLLLSKQLKTLPPFTYFGRYSIIILVTHRPVLNILTSVCNHFGLPAMPAIAIIFAATMGLMPAIILFVERYMGCITAQKELIPAGRCRTQK